MVGGTEKELSTCDIFTTMGIPNCQEYCLLQQFEYCVALYPAHFSVTRYHCSSYPSCYVVLSLCSYKRLWFVMANFKHGGCVINIHVVVSIYGILWWRRKHLSY